MPRAILLAMSMILSLALAPAQAAGRSSSAGLQYLPYTLFHAPYRFDGCTRWFRVWAPYGETYLVREIGCAAGRGARRKALRVKG